MNIDGIINLRFWTHPEEDGTITFDENDLIVDSIEGGELLFRDDYKKLFDSICDMDTRDLMPEEWYKFGFKRIWDYDEADNKYYWFELVEITLIE